MMTYDASVAPDAAAWLALDEQTRSDVVAEYHRVNRIPVARRDRMMHSAIHAIVETQIASNDPPEVTEAMTRLMAAGLERHEAVHAVGTTLARYMFSLSRGESTADDGHARYREAVAQLVYTPQFPA